MNKSKSDYIVSLKRDINTLTLCRNRIKEVQQENPTSFSEVLKLLQSIYALTSIIISDANTKIVADNVVKQFINTFLESIEQSIRLLTLECEECLKIKRSQ